MITKEQKDKAYKHIDKLTKCGFETYAHQTIGTLRDYIDAYNAQEAQQALFAANRFIKENNVDEAINADYSAEVEEE